MLREIIPTQDTRGFDFRSDNVAGAAPEILEAITAANRGSDSAYGEDAITKRLTARIETLFERKAAVFTVATGTAANALALAAITPPWGAVLCHDGAHIATDECGAPEFFTGGAKLVPLQGDHGKLSAGTIDAQLERIDRGVHHVRPAAVSLSQTTEAGTLYRPDEIAAIAASCHRRGLKVHMDGARFANAVAALGCSPAEASCKAGIDILSFGLTKNGAMAAEAVLFFDTHAAEDFAYRRKRGGHLFSKGRFAAAQLDAQLEGGLWLRLAAHANAMAARLAAGLQGLAGIALLHPVEANALFVTLPDRAIGALEDRGYRFYRWDAGGAPCIRLITAFDTEPAHIDALVEAATECLGEIAPAKRNL